MNRFEGLNTQGDPGEGLVKGSDTVQNGSDECEDVDERVAVPDDECVLDTVDVGEGGALEKVPVRLRVLVLVLRDGGVGAGIQPCGAQYATAI